MPGGGGGGGLAFGGYGGTYEPSGSVLASMSLLDRTRRRKSEGAPIGSEGLRIRHS